MPFRPAPSRRGHNVTQTGIAISRVLADRGSAAQLAHADPALRVACPVCEALSHQRCLERNPKQYVTPHAERAALIPAKQATRPLADELQRIADYEGGRRTTAPRVIQSAGGTQAFAAGGEPGKIRARD